MITRFQQDGTKTDIFLCNGCNRFRTVGHMMFIQASAGFLFCDECLECNSVDTLLAEAKNTERGGLHQRWPDGTPTYDQEVQQLIAAA